MKPCATGLNCETGSVVHPTKPISVANHNVDVGDRIIYLCSTSWPLGRCGVRTVLRLFPSRVAPQSAHHALGYTTLKASSGSRSKSRRLAARLKSFQRAFFRVALE